jgi:hypothetical protein
VRGCLLALLALAALFLTASVAAWITLLLCGCTGKGAL